MESAGHGFDFISAINWALSVVECFCFVDDTHLIEAASSPKLRGEFLVYQVQKALSLWSECIRTTGGAINPVKSFWWLIDFQWDEKNGKWNFRRNDDMAGEVHIKDLTNKKVKLVRLQPNQMEKTLGIKMAPQYNKKDQSSVVGIDCETWVPTPIQLAPLDENNHSKIARILSPAHPSLTQRMGEDHVTYPASSTSKSGNLQDVPTGCGFWSSALSRFRNTPSLGYPTDPSA